MKKTVFYFLFLLFLFPYRMTAQQEEGSPLKNYSKHEIGLSWGAFPTSGVFANSVDFATSWGLFSDPLRRSTLGPRYPFFAHRDSWKWDGYREGGESEKEYYSMQHYGCLTFNYQYHFTQKHSIGFTASWLGRYISNYTMKPYTGEIVNAKGWDNIFTLCINYRFTYYTKDAISLYTGIHLGAGIGFIERKLLFEAEESVYLMPGIQITGFGIEAGKTHAFMAELGFGAQGLLKVGYRYKFNNN